MNTKCQLFGLGEDDWLVTGAGNDYLDGGAGNDVQLGGEGNDQLGGDAGNDTLSGGAGDDIYVYRLGAGEDTIINTGGGTDWLIFTNDKRTAAYTPAATSDIINVSMILHVPSIKIGRAHV